MLRALFVCRFWFTLCVVSGFLVSAAHAQFTYNVLYNFGNLGDPIQPFYSGIIAQGRDGNMYSSIESFEETMENYGGAYKITPAGTLSATFGLNGTNGNEPLGGLTLGTDGNFYGTNYGGGFSSVPYGNIFRLNANSHIFTPLYTFQNNGDGALPTAPPIEGTDGNYYGTTCGACNGQGYGSIYKITAGGSPVFTPLVSCNETNCGEITGPLFEGTDGNFYGATPAGGSNAAGAIFRVTTGGKFSYVHSFLLTGTGPRSPNYVILGSDGNFYGTAGGGNPGGIGTIFKMTPAGKLTWIYKLNATADGESPIGLMQATDGNFYGVNTSGGANGFGTIFQITPEGVFSVVHAFDGTDGSTPHSTVFQHTNGLLYGTTQEGGTAVDCTCGVFWSVNIGASPFVAFVGQPAGKVGKTVEILGQGFTGTTAVSFNGTSASFKVVSGTSLTATVPAGAVTGTVQVSPRRGRCS